MASFLHAATKRLVIHRVFLCYALLILFITAFSYSRVTQAYFLNDEWLYISGVKTDGIFFLLRNRTWIELLTGLNRPLGTIIANFFYFTFHNSPLPFIVYGIVVHLINCLLLFTLINKISRKPLVALAGGLFFSATSAYAQAIGWLACSIEVPSLTFFTLLSVYFLFQYLETKQIWWTILSFFSAYVAFLFKDACIFLFLGLPLVLFLHESKLNAKTIPFYLSNLCIASASILSRLQGLSHVGQEKGIALYGMNNLLGGAKIYTQLLYDTFVYPTIGILEILIPARYLKKLFSIRYIQSEFTSNNFPFAVFLLFIVFGFCAFWLYRQNKKSARLLVSIIVLFVLSLMPVAVYNPAVGTGLIDSRFLYLPSVLLSILLGFAVHSLIRYTKQFKKSVQVSAIILFNILFSGYLLKQMLTTRSLITGFLYDQKNIQNLVNQLAIYTPVLPTKPIIFIDSDEDYFWPNNRVPFQEGTGFMLSTIFYESGKIPPELIQKLFLQKFGSQGYQEVEGRALGYYYDRQKLAGLYKSNPALDINQILAFQYNTRTKKLEPITKDLQSYISDIR